MVKLPIVRLKTREIIFDDRLNQVRVLLKKPERSLDFISYDSSKGQMYLKKYRGKKIRDKINLKLFNR